jgi:A/G-specific adenine glycosylase
VRRDLPWRRTRDPYRILVSEVMLQQTQAARVVAYYEAFLARFPDAGALAAAPAADVLTVWSGLGHNRRALALMRAAGMVAERGWPTTAAGLRSLPGVGPCTAAAIASAAFGEPVAVVDTNVRRVIERLDGRTRTPAALQARAQRLLELESGGEPARAAMFNQATMELGATVCTARVARCDACPLAACRSRGRVRPAVRRRTGAGASRAPRFEDTDRWVRGRIVAGLVTGEGLPAGVDAARLERALEGLVRDGLVERGRAGAVGLP